MELDEPTGWTPGLPKPELLGTVVFYSTPVTKKQALDLIRWMASVSPEGALVDCEWCPITKEGN